MPATAKDIRLSKSRFTAGVQCHKQLWWRVHEPDARELAPDPALQNRFEQGAEVNRKAREFVPGGELIDLPFYQWENRVAATREALARGARVIYEGGFVADDTFVQVDILERQGDAFRVIEVKASTRRKPEHIPDLAIQVHVLRRAGLPVRQATLMHLNPECRFPELSNLFVEEDVTGLVEGYLLGLPDELDAQFAMLHGPLPHVPIGDHCTRPYQCPFVERCWPKLPPHHVSTLYTIARNKALELEALGYATIYDLPSDLELSAIHARQVRAVTTGTIVVEPTLGEALAEFRGPLAYLDFETVSLAIPRWTGCRPWELVPVQFSVHTEAPGGRGRGRLVHHQWIADGPEDPRPELARRLIDACRGARSVVAYYAKFERACLEHLIAWVPDRAAELEAIKSKLVDLYPAVRNHVYHPDFGGHFSIKNVLPALVPGLSYADLAIGDGELATVELQKLLFKGSELPPADRLILRNDLLRYCERDSWAMVRLLDRLRRLARTDQLELGL
ncbi:MAG TPA: DUF2779 domain-containing protein [Gemmatimonadales bacterium]|nr:DUF2779 domain-containing protein [Gemmatimonadales bacterium]